MRGTGKHRPTFHLPVPLMKPPALLMGLVMSDPPVTVDQLDLLAVDNTPRENALEPVFGVHPRPFRGALDYLPHRTGQTERSEERWKWREVYGGLALSSVARVI